MRYFLFSYVTRYSTGNVKLRHKTMPSELYLIEEAIPKVAVHLPPDARIIITGFNEFQNEEDFDNFCGGHNMENEITNLFR
jgi:hypothetical protein